MAFDPTFGLFGTVTRALKLPEYGISEKLGGKTGSLERAMQDMTSFRPPEYDTQTTTGTSGGTSGGTSNYTNLYKPTSNKKTESAEDLARRLEKERKRQEAEERERILKQVRKSYDPFFQELSRQEAEIPNIEQRYLNTMNTAYQNQAGVIGRGQQAGLEQAAASQGQIKQNQATSLRDLALNLSSAVNAFGQRLGQAGAGDSSAANMANYAYSKIANRNTADVMNQVRQQLADVETVKQNIVRDAQDKLSALETWKANQTNVIAEYVNSLRDYINQARAQGKQALGQNEVDMIREGFARAQERMQQINDLAVTSRYEIEQNAVAALAEQQAFSNQLAAMGNVQVDPITGLPIDTGSISGSESSLLVPYGTEEEKEKSLSDLLYSSGGY
jgi:phenylalanyl-tRNA synthetase alpha subunit